MNKREKMARCFRAPVIEKPDDEIVCRVYSRMVGNCMDCSFSSEARPVYLRRRGIDPATEET